MKSIVYLIITFASFGDIHSQSTSTPYIDFRIDNTETVNKIIISDNTGDQFELHRNGDKWSDRHGDCISQNKVEFVLDAFKNIEFKGYLSDQQTHKYKNRDSISKIKVEIFQNDVNTKTWYFGPPTSDHFGQIMFVKSKDRNDTGIPVIMKLKGHVGIIEPLFFTDAKQWKCTTVYSVPTEDISKVVVVNNQNQEKSFSIEKNQDEIRIYNQNKLLTRFDTTMLYKYLGNFNRIDYQSPSYSLSLRQVDSLKNSIPFAEITVANKSGFSKTIKCYRIISLDGGISDDNYDRDHFWCELPPFGEIVKCHYFMFNPIFFGELYFPFDKLKDAQEE